MDWQNEKCVMVIDESLPLGVIANTAAILGVSLGKQLPEVVGADAVDSSGSTHAGIIAFPIPILRGTPQSLRALRARLSEAEFEDVAAVDFSDLSQGCRIYEEYLAKMRAAPESSLRYLGVALCGAKRKINRLTGSLPLLR